MVNVEHPYNYRKAVLAEQAKAGATGAIPNLADIAQQHAASQGRIAVQDQALKSDVAFAENKLAEQDRQFTTKLALDRQKLDTWKKQNEWATKIAIANLGVQALGIPANAKTLEKKELETKAIIDKQNEIIDLTKAANARREILEATARQERTRQFEAALAAKEMQSAPGDPLAKNRREMSRFYTGEAI